MPTQKGRQQKARKQKGRRHRTVNRTPRPVTRTRPPGSAGQGTGPAAPTAGAHQAPAVRPASGTTTAPPPAQAQSPAPGASRTGSAAPPEVFAPVSAGGLGRTAERSWRHLAAAGAKGAVLDEVSAAAGYQPATVTRHLEGLAERGFARLDGERWYAVAPQGAPAPA